MSSFLPNIIVTRAVSELGIKANLEQADVQSKIRAGLDRLYNFQHEDGGWGWWETDESHPFMTAYVVAGLAQAKAAGVQVEQDRVDRGAEWVRKALREDPRINPDLRAYMAWAVADKETIASIYEDRARLSPYGLALLGLALQSAGDARAGHDRRRRRIQRAAGCRAGLVALRARPHARFRRRHHPRNYRLRGEVPRAPAPAKPAAAQGRALADEPPQPGLVVEHHQADRHGDLRAHRLSEGHQRAQPAISPPPSSSTGSRR